MEIPFLALSKQLVLLVFGLVFTAMAIVTWRSDSEKHGSLPLKEDSQ